MSTSPVRRISVGRRQPKLPSDSIFCFIDRDSNLFMESYFREAIILERRRSARSGKPFLTMLVDLGKLSPSVKPDVIQKVAGSLFANTRDTDIKGWFRYNTIIGVIFTETDVSQRDLIHQKVAEGITGLCGKETADGIGISFHIFPDVENADFLKDGAEAGYSWEKIESYLLEMNERRRGARIIKRVLDIVGGILFLLLAMPFFIIIPVLIKLTSKGPVIFKQERIGLHGKRFTFLKFRSMRIGQSDAIHRAFVKDLIRGSNGAPDDKGAGQDVPDKKVYKIKNDPRITPIGNFLRKSSLDELPQFINVLRGEMSFVGPRPPIPYEVKDYDIWHLRRILDVKPGLTGLWQVKGRSSIGFDEMVRLDLQYARTWTLWMDLKLIVQTPFVMLRGRGAY
ncbi:MAG: sugar transferase [Actinomycetota bacterium]|nr:sugar transferase [Actinomycetota bacterium]